MTHTLGLGLRRRKNDKTLDVWFPYVAQEISAALIEICNFSTQDSSEVVALTPDQLSALAAKASTVKDELKKWVQHLQLVMVDRHGYDVDAGIHNGYADIDIVAVVLRDQNQAVASAEEAYLKLHMLSKRIIKPHGANMNGAFGQLTNVAWSNYGPLLPEDADEMRLQAFLTNKPLEITHVDKFPYMVNYVIPSGVRIASGSRVRLGAYLGEGSTVMPVGYVNFNAGTEGPSMVEGRVSAGVYVKKGSDLGGAASVMGTLSGGNDHVISIGENCLIGANAGTGISLGDNCTIAAGLYVYAGKKVALYDHEFSPVDKDGRTVSEGENIVKALELSGRDNMLFIADSQTGRLLCKPNGKTFQLNEALHKN